MSTHQSGLGSSRVHGLPLDRALLTKLEADQRVADLEREVADLRTALESRTVTSVATGILAERFGCTSSQAWAVLTRVSSHTNLKVRDVARVVVALVDGTLEPEDAELVPRLAPHLPGLLPAPGPRRSGA